LGNPTCPLQFGLEPVERSPHELGLDAAALEVAADRLVAQAALRQQRRSRLGEAAVIDVAGVDQLRHRRYALGLRDSRSLESTVELGGRQVAARKRFHGARERAVGRLGYATASSGVAAGSGAAIVGISRAETIWSGPAIAWMRATICWVTSGCSRRKAVAFWRP